MFLCLAHHMQLRPLPHLRHRVDAFARVPARAAAIPTAQTSASGCDQLSLSNSYLLPSLNVGARAFTSDAAADRGFDAITDTYAGTIYGIQDARYQLPHIR